MYIQTHSITIGPPFGPTKTEIYVFRIENKIFKIIITKPSIYVRYEDDIFIATHPNDEINKLKQTIEKSCVLNITNEPNINKKISFLDALTHSTNNNKFTTSYVNPTCDNSTLLNYHSECPQKYKIAIIKI